MTDYLDGVVHADFLADEDIDYIATDRQSLLWESPLLSTMRSFLSAEIKEACKRYQARRDTDKKDKVRAHQFTAQLIAAQKLNKGREKLAYKLAAALASAHKRGFNDPMYRSTLPRILSGMGQGELYARIKALAEEDEPELQRISEVMARLTLEEFESFQTIARGRLDGISSLKKIVEHQDFKTSDNEKSIQKLFEKNPWLVEPTYSQFLSTDQAKSTMFGALAKALKVGTYATDPNDRERPDLVSLVGNETMSELVIIELKSANLPLESKHLDQLMGYIYDAENWLKQHGRANVNVRGQLVGTLKTTGASRGVKALLQRMGAAGPNTNWRVRSYLSILEDAEAAHRDIIEADRG